MVNNIERFKIVLLGNCSVGKTSLLVRYVKKKYGNVFWLPQVKLFSRVHGNNESFTENTMHRRKLIRLLLNDKIIKKDEVLAKYYLCLSVMRKKNQDGTLLILKGLLSRKEFLNKEFAFLVLRNFLSKLANRFYAFAFLRKLNNQLFK